MAILADIFPKSRLVAQKHMGIDASFTKFVLCLMCLKRYLFKDSWHHRLNTFVHHPRRAPCNALLLKSIELCSGRKVLHPHKIYCYKSLTSSTLFRICSQLQPLVYTTGQVAGLSGIFMMVKYGSNVSGIPFLSDQFSYGLVLNIDWFQPYSHTVASVGVIYLAVMNLPRHLRYKREKMLLLGIIPGPS